MSNRLPSLWRIDDALAASLVALLLGGLLLTSAKADDLAPLGIDSDLPQWFEPFQPRSETDSDRVEATALYSAGAAYQRRGELDIALRCYQRAFRCDPQSPTLIKAVIALTVQLRWEAEAARYGLLAVSITDAEPRLLQALAAYQSQQGNLKEAIRLYEKTLSVLHDKQQPREALAVRMELARLCFETDRFRQAAEHFAQVLHDLEKPGAAGIDEAFKNALLGDAGLTYRQIGESLLAIGRIDEAEAMFAKLQQTAPDKPTADFLRARLQLKRGQPAEALASLDASFAAHLAGEGLVPYEVLRDALQRLNKKDELIDRLEKLHGAEPKNLSLAYFLGQQYRTAGMLEKAEKLYRQMLQLRPMVTVYRDLVDVYRQTGRPDELLDTMSEAIEKTGVLHVLSAEGQTVSGDPQAMPTIVAAARKRLAGPQKLPFGAIVAAALLTLEAKQFDAAATFFDAALAAEKSLPTTAENLQSSPPRAAELFMVWGVGLLNAERAADAAQVFQRAIDAKATADDNPIFHFYLAGALAMADRIDQALAAARTAAERKQGSPRFQARPAWVLYAGKRYPEATKAYLDLLARFENDRDTAETRDVLRDARLTLANIAVEQGDLPQAEEWLAQVLDEFPEDAGAMNDLGYLWADQNRHLRRAHRMIQRAVEEKPDSTAYRDSLGWVLFRLGRYTDALVELEKAAVGKPDGTVLEHLGDTYVKLGRPEKAAEAWRRAAAAFQKEQQRQKAEAVQRKLAKTAK